MPTYEYECKSCGHRFDAFQNIRDEPLKVCPECGKELRRLINGGSGVIFKGGGFYVTDKGGKAASSEKTAAVGKPDAGGKTAEKADAKTAASSKESASKPAETPKTEAKAG
jgi:putative FmdB family regulatory protein